ncbi:MAG: hypothetical protein PHR68_03265 [Candidatus Gracilibacteria bacterium]|nr:hypothetical protein [Candidatus Gracilibacteria bacterium]
MTTITLNDPIIEAKYNSYEIKLKFLDFIKKELKQDSIDLYEISVENLPTKTKDRFKNIDNLNFIEY